MNFKRNHHHEINVNLNWKNIMKLYLIWNQLDFCVRLYNLLLKQHLVLRQPHWSFSSFHRLHYCSIHCLFAFCVSYLKQIKIFEKNTRLKNLKKIKFLPFLFYIFWLINDFGRFNWFNFSTVFYPTHYQKSIFTWFIPLPFFSLLVFCLTFKIYPVNKTKKDI